LVLLLVIGPCIWTVLGFSSFPPSWKAFALKSSELSPATKGVKATTLNEELTPYSPGISIL